MCLPFLIFDSPDSAAATFSNKMNESIDSELSDLMNISMNLLPSPRAAAVPCISMAIVNSAVTRADHPRILQATHRDNTTVLRSAALPWFPRDEMIRAGGLGHIHRDSGGWRDDMIRAVGGGGRDATNRAVLDGARDSTNRAVGDGGRDATNRAVGGFGRDATNRAVGGFGRDATNRALGDGGRDATNRALGDGGCDDMIRALGDGARDAMNRALGDGGRDDMIRALGDGARDATNRALGDGERDITNRALGDGGRDTTNRAKEDGGRDTTNRAKEDGGCDEMNRYGRGRVHDATNRAGRGGGRAHMNRYGVLGCVHHDGGAVCVHQATSQDFHRHSAGGPGGFGRGAAEIQRTTANQVYTQDFHGGGYRGGRGFPGRGRDEHPVGWGEGNSRRGGEWVSGHGDYHGGGGRGHPTGHGYPPPHHMKSRGKRGGKREKERRQKRAKHGTTKPSHLSAEKPTNQPSTKPVRPPFTDDSDTADKPTNQPSDLSADKPTDQPSELSADKPMHSLPDSSDESEGAIVEEIRRALRKKKASKMEEAEGLLAREMRNSEEEVQTRAGAGGLSNEHINTPPSNELSNAPSSNVHINASLRKKPINTPPSNELSNASPNNKGEEEEDTHDDSDDDDSSSARNMARITKLGINKVLETKKTTKRRKSAPRLLPSDRPSRRNPLRSSRYNSKYELHDEEESKNEEKDDYEDNGSSEGGVPCAAPSDKEVEGSSKRGEPCAAPSDVMNADIMIDTPMSNLNVGSRVLVDYKGTLYNATIRKHRVKSGKQEFQIHYDGNKKPTLKWIPVNCIQSIDVASNQPDEVLCDNVLKDSPLTITTGIDLAPGVGASPGVSIYTVLSGPSPERVSIYDNWPQEECYTVRKADIPQETRLMKLVRRLNELKDLPRSKATIKRMKHYTAQLKESKMKHEGPYDQLDQRGSHRLKSTDRGNGIGLQAIPIDTNIDCPGQRPSIKSMVDFAESMDGASLETGVIFRDVSKRFYINKSMSRIGDNCRWIVSTEGDCLFAFKHHGKMWIKIHDTLRTVNGYVNVNLPAGLTNKKDQANLHEAIFYTFTTMKNTGEYKPTIDHINRKKTDNRWVNLRAATQKEQNQNRGVSRDARQTDANSLINVKAR